MLLNHDVRALFNFLQMMVSSYCFVFYVRLESHMLNGTIKGENSLKLGGTF